MESSIILFDGVCNLCSQSVQFVIEKDRQELYQFASLQSDEGRALLEQHQLPTNGFKSFVLIEKEKVYTQSTAAIKVMSSFGGLWKMSIVFMLLPTFIRNTVYNYIAKNRYKWFGKADSCWLPNPNLKKRFL